MSQQTNNWAVFSDDLLSTYGEPVHTALGPSADIAHLL